MTPQAKTQMRRFAFSAAIAIVGLLLQRPFLPWIFLLLAAGGRGAGQDANDNQKKPCQRQGSNTESVSLLPLPRGLLTDQQCQMQSPRQGFRVEHTQLSQ